MRKMFSESDPTTAINAARKSASVRSNKAISNRAGESNPHGTALLWREVFSQVLEDEWHESAMIDFDARKNFLSATSIYMSPAPIESLSGLIADFARFVEAFPADMQVDALSKIGIVKSPMKWVRYLPESVALRTGIEAWMNTYNFRDAWIADGALTTLAKYHQKKSGILEWHVSRAPEVARRHIREITSRPFESDHEFLNRADNEYNTRRKKCAALISFQTGSRHGNVQPAELTARVFAGMTLAEIAKEKQAEIERKDRNTRKSKTIDVSDSAIRKAVASFCRRAKITLPKKASRRSSATN